MKNYYAISILFLLFLSCLKSQSNVDIKVENPAFDEELKGLLSFDVPVIGVDELAENYTDAQLLDARERKEFEISRIPGADYVGYNHWDKKVLDKLDKDRPIVVYCSVGYRSEKIAQKLQKKGFKKVYNLYGSIFEWVNQGHPIVNAEGLSTDQLHTYNKNWSQWVDNPNIKKVY